jgi:hydrogenase-4 component E
MSPLLITLLGVHLVPLFMSTWRASLLGLSCQGLLMAWVAYRLNPELQSVSDFLTLADLALLRGVIAPWLLYRVLRSHNASPRNDVIPPNLLSWTVALAFTLLAFRFTRGLVPEGDERTLVSVAAAGVLLGFLVLATQSGPFSQIVGVLRIENAIALFELGGTHHHGSLWVRLGQVLILVVSLVLYRWYLMKLDAHVENAEFSPVEEPTL